MNTGGKFMFNLFFFGFNTPQPEAYCSVRLVVGHLTGDLL
jgi:hypothetical protein